MQTEPNENDMHMVDTPERRADRKIMPAVAEGYEYNRFPARAQRRKIAKSRGVFKTPGLFGQISKGRTNKQTASDEPQI